MLQSPAIIRSTVVYLFPPFGIWHLILPSEEQCFVFGLISYYWYQSTSSHRGFKQRILQMLVWSLFLITLWVKIKFISVISCIFLAWSRSNHHHIFLLPSHFSSSHTHFHSLSNFFVFYSSFLLGRNQRTINNFSLHGRIKVILDNMKVLWNVLELRKKITICTRNGKIYKLGLKPIPLTFVI